MEDKLRLRSLNLNDAQQLYEIYSDTDAMKYRASKAMKTIENAKEFIQNQRKTNGNILTIRKGVELLKEGEIIGSCMVRVDQRKKNELEIGYSIGRQYWGQGFGTEIVKLLVKNIRNNKKEISNIIAWCHKENIASILILNRNGFVQDKNESLDKYDLFRKSLK